MKLSSDGLLGQVFTMTSWTDAHHAGDQLVRHTHTVTVTGVDYQKNALRVFDHGSRASQTLEYRAFKQAYRAGLVNPAAVAPYGGAA